jgi:hypothetical protein
MLNLQEFIYVTKIKVLSNNANDEDYGAEASDDDEFFKLKKLARGTAPAMENVVPLSSLGSRSKNKPQDMPHLPHYYYSKTQIQWETS